MKKIIYLLFGIAIALYLSGCDGTSKDVREEPHIVEDTTPQYTYAGWYMKTSVSAIDPVTLKEYSHKTAGVFGELNDSTDDKDRHDIPGYGNAILQVVFVQTSWGNDNGDYFSDYRANSSDATKKVWTFQVKNEKDVHLENSDLTITVDGVYDVSSLERDGRTLYREKLLPNDRKKRALKLVDVDNNIVYAYDNLQKVDLSMDGLNIRTFRWVIGDIDEADSKPLVTAKSVASKNTTSPSFLFEEKPSVNDVFESTIN